MSRYSFSEYSPKWPAAFQTEAAAWSALLGDALLELHHIGSTSVPGLAAKPTIDLLPVVREIEPVDELESRIVNAGYKAWGEYGLPGRRLFTKDTGDVRTCNIHIYPEGHSDIERHVAFRNYLRAHPPACSAYEAVKRKAYRLHPADIVAYNDAKSGWIRHIEQIALKWYAGQRDPEASW